MHPQEGVPEIQKSITLQGHIIQTECTAISRTTQELPGKVSWQDLKNKVLIDPTLKRGTGLHPEQPSGPLHNRAADKEVDLSVGTPQAKGAINHTLLVVGDRKITETVIVVAQRSIPAPEPSDGQEPIILSDLKLFPPPGRRERKSSQ